jgi:hypothetical protein
MPIPDTSYKVIQPFPQGDFLANWQSCHGQLIAIVKEGRSRIFKINLFVHSLDRNDFQSKKQFLTEQLLNTFGEECPTFGILANSPEKPYNLVLEIGLINAHSIKMDYRKHKGWRYTIIEKSGYKELWANGIESEVQCRDTKTASEEAFIAMHHILLFEKMTIDNIVRQWNYIGKILSPDSRNSLLSGNYQIFNSVRQDFYHTHRLVPDFPAATGVGVDFTGVTIDFCAIAVEEDVKIISIKNPVQINPYNYDHKVLVGKQEHEHKENPAPLFERAKLIIFENKYRMYVSGTASIIGQDTIGKGDIREQTAITILNILKLTSSQNLISFAPQLNHNNSNIYDRIRVYVKNDIDIPIVKSICIHHFGNIPTLYVKSDICRTDLLVEIEADLKN